MRIILLLFTVFAMTLTLAADPADAARRGEFPRKPIQLITPFGAGSTTDLAARSLANSARPHLPHPITVINRPGAAGVVAAASVATAAPDGYTLLMARVSSNASVPAMNKTIPYKVDDFTFIAVTEINPYVFVVLADSPYKTLQDLADAIKANPGGLSYGTSGALTPLDILGMMLVDAAGLPKGAAVSVPFGGDGEAKTALLGGHVQFVPSNLSPVVDVIKSGQVRPLAVTTETRVDLLPDVPTVAEAGFPQLTNVVGWSGLVGPKGMRPQDVEVLANLMQTIKNDPEWIQTTHNLGAIPHVLSPEEAEKFIMDQYRSFSAIGERMGIIIQ